MRLLPIIIASAVGFSCGGDPQSIADHEPGSTDSLIGDPCTASADCVSTCYLDDDVPSDFPDGFCSVPCASDADCPADAACIDKKGGLCLLTCGRDGDFDCTFLGPGWRCDDKDNFLEQEIFVCIGD